MCYCEYIPQPSCTDGLAVCDGHLKFPRPLTNTCTQTAGGRWGNGRQPYCTHSDRSPPAGDCETSSLEPLSTLVVADTACAPGTGPVEREEGEG